jgi:hypothetical protein
MVVSAGERTGDYDHSLASLVNAKPQCRIEFRSSAVSAVLRLGGFRSSAVSAALRFGGTLDSGFRIIVVTTLLTLFFE